MEESKEDFNLLLLDTVDTILKMHNIKDKRSPQYKYLHVHTLGNINMMYEVIHDN